MLMLEDFQWNYDDKNRFRKNKIVDYLKKNIKNKEVVIIMGAGDIYKLIDQF